MDNEKHLPESTQAQRFRDLARQLECDEDEARFEDQVRKIASAPKSEKPVEAGEK